MWATAEVLVAARRRMATTLVAGALVVVLGGCGSDDEIPESASVEDLTADPSGAFDLDDVEAGQRISLRVTVGEVLSRDAFVVPPKETAGGPLLVLAGQHGASPGDTLQIGGIARVFSYEEQSGDFELGPQSQYAKYEDKVVLVATLNDDDLPLDDK